MRLHPEHAHTLLTRVDPGRMRSGRAVGLRDGALLALVAAGFSAVEIAALRASAITMENRRAVVRFQRYGTTGSIVLPTDLGARLLVWLTEAELWGRSEPLFRGCRGPLTPIGIRKVIERCRNHQAAPGHRKAV
ncbi:MAG TPA: hypothetical protein DD490_29515 [Acidobacteria bacterium]|nr:hypothetical protein [Acidobacteriota bacterium]